MRCIRMCAASALCVAACAESTTKLTAANFAAEVDAHTGEPYVWVVKFYSEMCGSCQALVPTWDKLRESVPGVHWGEVSIDEKENVALASKYGVLDEGIPNIKLFTADGQAQPILTGDTIVASDMSEAAALTEDAQADAQALTKVVAVTLIEQAAEKAADGFYKFEL
jgi:thiol-disulfide isomerase/thioredoxin